MFLPSMEFKKIPSSTLVQGSSDFKIFFGLKHYVDSEAIFFFFKILVFRLYLFCNENIVNKYNVVDVTESEDQATHVIYPTCDPLEEEYARPTFRRDRMVMLHWYYFPDSYDSWTAADLPVDPPDSPQPRTGPWRVRLLYFILYIMKSFYLGEKISKCSATPIFILRN